MMANFVVFRYLVISKPVAIRSRSSIFYPKLSAIAQTANLLAEWLIMTGLLVCSTLIVILIVLFASKE